MDKLIEISKELIADYGAVALFLMLILLIVFTLQLRYYIAIFGRIIRYKLPKKERNNGQNGAISVVVVVRGENADYLENRLPLLLEQEYEQYEVVVVDVGTTEEFSIRLEAVNSRYANLKTTRINQDPKFPISDKMAYNVGVKSAQYENIILTTMDAEPTSMHWLEKMSRGFETGEVVLGYCGMAKRKGGHNKYVRCCRLMMGMNYLAYAIGGEPYRGTIHNMGFTQKVYFDNNGFSHLNMNAGEDDLFVQKIATPENTIAVVHPDATMREDYDRSWWGERKFRKSTHKYYTSGAKNHVNSEILIRVVFFAVAAALLAISPLEMQMVVVALILLRLLTVWWVTRGVRMRLAEGGLGWMHLLYDVVQPIDELLLNISCRLRKPGGIWR